MGVRAHMGGFGKAVALGLGLRHDWGSQYRARQFQAEIKWLGIRSTPAYVGEPECNGVAERFIQTLKEECIYLQRLRNARVGQRGDRGLRRALQQRLAAPAARVHDPGPCPREVQPEGGLMFRPSTCPGNQDRTTLCRLSFYTPLSLPGEARAKRHRTSTEEGGASTFSGERSR